jgi:deoxyribonuclease-1
MRVRRSRSALILSPMLLTVFLIVTFAISLKSLALQPRNPFRNPSSQYLPYYSQNFYSALQISSKDENLKYVLKSILRNYHIFNPGQLDTLTERCPADRRNCYQQISLGYERARIYLMGYLYLVKHQNDYLIKEAYCNKYYGPNEFRGGRGPAPQTVPDYKVINVEHTWPQSRFNGRYDKEFQKADLHHLFPTDSQLNEIRSNNKFGEVISDFKALKCGQSRYGVSKASHREVFEPPNPHKGRVARALFYFSIRYDLPIDTEEEAFLKKWNAEYPVDQEEITRNEEIYKTQGNRNPFIDYPELAMMISDF